LPRRIYLDHAATTPVDPEVVQAMLPYFSERFGNASSLHRFGREAHEALEAARRSVAELIGAEEREIVFTSGGTESDNLAIKGLVLAQGKKPGGPHVVTSRVEHPAVLESCRYLESLGFQVEYLPVNREGLVDLAMLEKAISPATVLVTIQHANNEIGTVQPLEEIGEIAREKGVLFHTDAVQSVGKIPVDVKRMNVNMLSLSSHKIHGPKGVGALYVQGNLAPMPLLHGGGHEKNLRSGTENIPGIVGLGKAAELAAQRMEKDRKYLTGLRDRLIRGILEGLPKSWLNGHPTQRLPHNAHFGFAGIEGEALILGLDEKGIAASTGSACSSKKSEPSHILRALGLNDVEARGSLRLTLGRENTEEEVDYAVEAVCEVVCRLREMSPLWEEPIIKRQLT